MTNILLVPINECHTVHLSHSSLWNLRHDFLLHETGIRSSTITFFEANRLYNQADNMLNTFLKSNCGCSGNNYQINFN